MALQNTQGYTGSSAYYTTPVVEAKYLDILSYRSIPQDPTDVYYEIPAVYQYRPDLLAFDLYNDSQLWWVFAARNPNRLGQDPYFNFVAGIGIYIPTITTLKTVLGI